ncbi:hypothetical protein DERP_011151 [Dermatophagoides pteronyssinus]|uniref:Uncharacterized protein n=1 Tax=Dermatophagoides pteronyssinus TaxID=6956 RepID=A0ABQ8J8X6_DERPT|nr:hypothetical protein DERP_011151 [Dermatophagoides pteronyssinus]
MNSFSAEEIVEKPAWDNVKICLNRRIPCGRHYTYVATQKWLDCKLNFIYENDGANGSQYSMMIRTVEPLFKNLGFSMKIKTIPVTSFIMLHSVGDLKIEFHAHAEGAEKNDFTMQVSSLKKLVNISRCSFVRFPISDSRSTISTLKQRVPSGGYEPRNAWTECPLYFVHESDFWAPEQRYHMSQSNY